MSNTNYTNTTKREDHTQTIEKLKKEVRLLGDRVLVVEHEYQENKTKTGLIIPVHVTEEVKPTEGTLVAISEQIVLEAKPHEKVDLGDILVFSKFAGYYVKVNGVEYKCLRLTDVIAVINQ